MKLKRKHNYEKDVNSSIIKSNLDIKEFLYKRIVDEGLSFADVIRMAKKNHIKIDPAQLSRYLNTDFSVKNGVSEEGILWLSECLGVEVELNVKYKTNFKL